ncbi:hypothetical protein BHM03_00022361, partial [Ensete ventricosum]
TTATAVMAAKRNDSSDGVYDVIQATEPGSRALGHSGKSSDRGTATAARCTDVIPNRDED